MRFKNSEEIEQYIRKEGTEEIWLELDEIVDRFWENDKSLTKEDMNFVVSANKIFPDFMEKLYPIIVKYINGEKVEIENQLESRKN
ncbi:MAG: hypothetical protein JW700_01915 [Candidatus Aenigmarchaeota archaeon]|nr:hypothetical protein [Candidatus Aenigmarchaeota archaeon]